MTTSNGFKSLVLLLLIQAVTFAQAKAVIKGPEKALPGDLVVLSGADSLCDNHKWITPSGINALEVACGDGREIIFASGKSGTYRFYLLVADKTAAIDYAEHVVVIGNPTQPPVDPVEPPPSDYADVAKVSKDAAAIVADPTTAAQLATAITQACDRLANDDLTKAKNAMVATIENVLLMRLGDSRRKDWESWRKAVNAVIANKSITATSQYVAAMRAVASGLK